MSTAMQLASAASDAGSVGGLGVLVLAWVLICGLGNKGGKK